MKFDVVKTVYCNAIQACNLFGSKYIPLVNTTINEIMSIDVVSTSGDKHEAKYYMLGLNYDDLVDTNVVNMDTVRHSPTDAIVFKPIPLICRKINEDLTVEESEDFYLRVEETYNNELYACYYGKKLSRIDSKVSIIAGDILYDNVNIYKYQANGTELSPIPLITNDIYEITLNFIVSSLTVDVKLSNTDITNIMEGIALRYPNVTNPRIGEVSIVSGIEVTTAGVTELAEAQSSFFIKSDYVLNDLLELGEDTIGSSFEVGGMESLITREG